MKAKDLKVISVNVFDVMANCKEISSCKFGYGFVARSEPKFRAPKATAAEYKDTFGVDFPKIIKVTKVTNARAYDYAKAVGRQMTKNGSEGGFHSDPMKGYDWVIPNIIKRATKDGNLQLCVTYKDNDKTSFTSVYIVQDHLATDAELEFIKGHLYVSPKSKKQTELGIASEDVVNVRNYKFSNVVAIGTTPEVEKFWESIEED